MKIKSREQTFNQIKKQEPSKESDSIDIEQTIKDIVTLGPLRKGASNLILNYRDYKIEQTKTKEEPWWTEMADAFLIQGDIAHGLNASGKALFASGGLACIGAVALTAMGTKEIKEGLKEKDKIKVLGGTSAILAGASSGADVLSSAVKGFELFGQSGKAIAAGSEMTGKVLAVAFGGIDMFLGTRELIHGIKEKNKEKIIDGSLEAGIGGAMIVTAAGLGGVYAPLTMGGLFVIKLAYDNREAISNAGKKLALKIKGEDKDNENTDKS